MISMPNFINDFVLSYWLKITDSNFENTIFKFSQCPFTNKINVNSLDHNFFEIYHERSISDPSHPITPILKYTNDLKSFQIEKSKLIS